MLAQRLNALEADLQLLLAMQDLFLDGKDDDLANTRPNVITRPRQPPRTYSVPSNCSASFPNDAPERDVSRRPRQKDKCAISDHNFPLRKNSSKDSRNEIVSDLPSNVECITIPQSTPTEIHSQAVENLTKKLTQEKVLLQQKVDEEKSLRVEAEESAKKVYTKLQKTEDELAREKQTKESLLMGTLQLKNLVQSFNSKMKETDKELLESRDHVEQLQCEMKSLSEENSKLFKSLENFCMELGYHSQNNGGPFFAESSKKIYFEFLRKKFHDLIQKSVHRDHEEVNKLASQLNNVVGRCAKLERERDEVLREFEQCQRREEQLKNQLHSCEVSLSSFESDMLKKQIEYECVVKQLQSEVQIEKDKAAIRISEYSSVIQRSKSLLTSLKNERDEHRRKVKELRIANQNLECMFKSLESDRQNRLHELNKLKREMEDVVRDKTQFYEKSHADIMKLETNLKRTDLEKRRCLELLNEMKNQLVSLKNKYEHDMAMENIEKEKLKNENTRLDENFRVLQKISEDQGHTIQKLRGDLENYKNKSFKLETELRDHESTENQVIRKLEESENHCQRYLKHIDQLQDKLEKYEDDLRQHDCDEFVDSKYKKKLTDLEKSLDIQRREWEESRKRLEGEKNEAISTARKALEKIEEIKNAHNSQISQVKTQCQVELGQLLQRHQRTDVVKTNKIMELQSELDRMKNSSSQIQQALSTKIQQLQQALGICLGTGPGGPGLNQTCNGNNNSSLGLLESLHQLPHHQQNQMCPSAAFGNGNAGIVRNNGFANNNAACGSGSTGNANLLLNLNSANGSSGHHHQQQHQAQTTCFGNSNVNSCTSGIVNSDSFISTGEALGLGLGGDFIGNNLI